MATEIAERKPYPKNRKSRGSMLMAKRTLVYGVGINDNPEPDSGKADNRAYRLWVGILKRCHGPRAPHYAGCSIDTRWYRYTTFASWLVASGWNDSLQIDKDLLVPGNRIYGPDTCLLVSPRANTILNTNAITRGALPIGVYRASKSSWGGQCNLGSGSVHLGVRPTPLEAHQLWQAAKVKEIRDVTCAEPDARVVARLNREADLIEFELENNMETIR